MLIFTTHGQKAVDMMRNKRPFGLDEAIIEQIVYSYDITGFGYANYDDKYPVYGISASSQGWIKNALERFPDFKICYLAESGWGYQDVYGVVKL